MKKYKKKSVRDVSCIYLIIHRCRYMFSHMFASSRAESSSYFSLFLLRFSCFLSNPNILSASDARRCTVLQKGCALSSPFLGKRARVFFSSATFSLISFVPRDTSSTVSTSTPSTVSTSSSTFFRSDVFLVPARRGHVRYSR